jgi:hypothetical protein
MYCATGERGGWLEHDDQYRGLRYSYVEGPKGGGATTFAEPSPDYFQYVDHGGPGLVPVGYGYRSIEYIVERALELQGLSLEARQAKLRQWDEAGIMATPANSRYNEAVVEAARESIAKGGALVDVKRL